MNALRVSRADDLPPLSEVSELAELWAWALSIALLGSSLCFSRLPGVNWVLWTALAATGFLVTGRRARVHADRRSRGALTLAILLSIAAAVTASPHADALIFLSVASLFAFSVLSIAAGADEIGPRALARAPLDLIRLLLAEAAARTADTLAVLRMRAAVPVVRGSAMAIALVAALFLLLSAADPTMAGWREIAWQAILSWTFLSRDVFFLVLAVALLGAYGLAARGSRAAAETAGSGSRSAATAGVRFSDLERLIVLGAALGLFVVFFVAELSSQLGAAAHLAPGETFAEATHRGFGEMILADALCALVIMTLDQRALRDGRTASVRLVSWGVIAASLLVVASAYQRVRYYEMAYGYTEPRLYVQACCAWVALALMLLAWELRSAIAVPRLMRHAGLAAIVCVAGLSYWNSAAWIVDANVARYESTGKLDVSYLQRLARSSPDAIPALIAALPRLAPSHARSVRESLRQASPDRSILVPPGGSTSPSWYEWSLRRAAARSALRRAGLLEGMSP